MTVADPPTKRLVKGEAATGAPAAGRTAPAVARHGPFGFLHLLGPGLVTGASDDDPSGIATYSQVGSQFGYGLLAIPILSASSAYAVKELTGLHGSLATRPQYRPTFYAIIVVGTLVGLAFNFLGVNPIAMLFITAVINGVVCAPLLALIVLLGADRRVMRRRTSGRLSLGLTWAAVAATGAAALALVVSPLLHRS